MKPEIDSRIRSIVKSISWRILAFIITILASFFVFGSWEISISVAIAADFMKIFFYYAHERLWEKISWGRVNK